MAAQLNQDDPPKPEDLPKYRGFQGAVFYGLFLIGLMVGLAALAYGFVVFATGNQTLGSLVFMRVSQLGVITGLVAGFSRWVSGGVSNFLYSPKLVKGDLGGIFGWLVGLCVAGALTQGGLAGFFLKGDGNDPLVGQTPAIAGPTVDGGKFDLAANRGKVVLIDFWASWCGPCVAEIPNIQEAYDAYHDKGLEVVSISLDFDRQSLDRFLKKSPHPWPQVYFDREGQRGFDNPLAREFKIDSIPRIWLVNQEGKVVASNLRGEDISRESGKLLGIQQNLAFPKMVSFSNIGEWLVKGILFSPIEIFCGAILGFGFAFAMVEALIRKGMGW